MNTVVLNRWSRFIGGFKPGFLDDCYIDVKRFQSRRQLLRLRFQTASIPLQVSELGQRFGFHATGVFCDGGIQIIVLIDIVVCCAEETNPVVYLVFSLVFGHPAAIFTFVAAFTALNTPKAFLTSRWFGDDFGFT